VRPSREGGSRRRFDYERRLLPNRHIATLEPESVAELAEAVPRTGHTIGYPAWNLLYYALYCSLIPRLEDPVVIETGTNRGVSTIVLAQALKDLGAGTRVLTVELQESLVATARQNVAHAGLGDYVEFHTGDGLEFLSGLRERIEYVDFALIDDDHSFEHVAAEIDLVCPLVAKRRGKAYFDNTARGGVADALKRLRERYGGSVVEFDNCSWKPPGNAIWQPD
jgi:predicted O-methyltransferase YrrM